MKTTLTQHEAADMLMKFEAFGTCDDAFSLCYSMAQYLEQYEEGTGEELELDPVAIRCKYRAITLDEAVREYQIPPHLDDEDVLEWLNDCTRVIETDIEDTYIIGEF
jgi:Cft2 family RNA processing exonuclease